MNMETLVKFFLNICVGVHHEGMDQTFLIWFKYIGPDHVQVKVKKGLVFDQISVQNIDKQPKNLKKLKKFLLNFFELSDKNKF